MNGFNSSSDGKLYKRISPRSVFVFKPPRGVFFGIAALLAASVIAPLDEADAASNWGDRPAWSSASSGGARQRRSQTSLAEERGQSIAPFAPGSNNVALHVGQVFLMGDLADSYSDNIGTQVHYTYAVSDIFGFNASLGYSEHSDGKYSVATFLSGLRTNLNWYDRVIPYLVFGLGFYKPSYELGDATFLSPVLFGLHLGPGVDLQLTDRFFFGAALTFHDVFGTTRTDTKGVAREVGGTFTSFLLHAGVSF